MIVTGTAGTRYPYHPRTIAQQLDRVAAEHGDREALVDRGRRLTWTQTRTEARRVAKALVAAGVRRGDHVAVWVPNRIEWVALWFAAAHVGAVIVPVNTRYKVDEVRYILGQSDARLLFALDRFAGIDYLRMLERLCPGLAGGGPPSADLPQLRAVTVLGEAPAGTSSFEAFVEHGDGVGDEELDALADAVAPDDPTIIVYTSGTTGHPKGAVHSHVILRNEHSIAEAMDVGSHSRVMNHMPFFHVAGAFTGILPPLISGGAMVLMDRWDPTEALELIERERITVFSGIPTHFIDLLNHPRRAELDLSSLHSGWIGGANNPPEVLDRVVDVLGVDKLLPVYGMTETTSITNIPKLEDPREVVVAGLGYPVSDIEVMVADVATGAELDAGQEGEVWVRGHVVMQGYYEDPEATAAVMDEAGWFHTGDLGVLDERGYLAITGRKSDMFIVGGANAYPAEIEGALSRHQAVKQAYVVGVPHARLGEVGFAFVERHPGAELGADDLVAYCREHVADYKVPRAVEFVDEWPLTATGKIQRFVLKERAAELARQR